MIMMMKTGSSWIVDTVKTWSSTASNTQWDWTSVTSLTLGQRHTFSQSYRYSSSRWWAGTEHAAAADQCCFWHRRQTLSVTAPWRRADVVTSLSASSFSTFPSSFQSSVKSTSLISLLAVLDTHQWHMYHDTKILSTKDYHETSTKKYQC